MHDSRFCKVMRVNASYAGRIPIMTYQPKLTSEEPR